MKKGFTMIELIFVIVILGILAAVAIPRLAATRDDATAAAMKSDISTATQAIPAWYQGQKDARIAGGMPLDSTKWARTGSKEEYKYTDEAQVCVTIAIYDMNISGGTYVNNGGPVTLDANGTWAKSDSHVGIPVLRIIKTDGATPRADPTGTVCKALWNDMGLAEQNISMGGQKVQW